MITRLSYYPTHHKMNQSTLPRTHTMRASLRCKEKRSTIQHVSSIIRQSFQKECVVCMQNKICTIVHHQKSTHVCMCRTCALKILNESYTCPMCRQPIDTVFIFQNGDMNMKETANFIQQSIDKCVPDTNLKLSSLTHYSV
jgi:hypothetical protein